jgi:predicted TIM-barrel fold metal-dependent hydrolase
MNVEALGIGHEIASARSFGRLVPYAVVDTETHVFVRCWPIETSPQMSAVDPFTRAEHSGALLVAEMDRVGVDLAILIGYDGYDFESFMRRHGSVPGDFMGGRGYTRAWAARFPARLKYVTTLHDPKRHSDALTVLDGELAAGAIGVKIFPPYLGSQADAPEIRAALDIVRDRAAAVAFGFEDTVPPATPPLSEMYEGVARLAGDYPGVPIQLNHGGNADPFGEDARLLFEIVNAHENLLVSTSVLGGVMMEWTDGWRYPFPDYLSRLEAYARALLPERLAWGTDWPWFEGVVKYPQLLQAIVDHASFLSEGGKRLYLGGNALRHWRLVSEPRPEAPR